MTVEPRKEDIAGMCALHLYGSEQNPFEITYSVFSVRIGFAKTTQAMMGVASVLRSSGSDRFTRQLVKEHMLIIEGYNGWMHKHAEHGQALFDCCNKKGFLQHDATNGTYTITASGRRFIDRRKL